MKNGVKRKISVEFSKELELLLVIMNNNRINLKETEILCDINWDVFLKLVEHHRLYPLVYKKLKYEEDIPSNILKTLAFWYKRNTFQMLQLSAEMEYLSKLLADEGIQSLFLKGPVLAYTLYNDLSMRTSKDIDILVQIKDLDSINQILLEHGYKRDEYNRTVLEDWKWKNHHIEYYNPQKCVSLEIHWRMNPGPGKEPNFKDLWDRKRKSPINCFPVYFLGREDLFVYLISHGARHGWFRLRWLTDIDQLSKQQIDWNVVFNLFKKYQFEHLGGQANILASSLIGTNIPYKMNSRIKNEKSNFLAQKAMLLINQMENLHNENLSSEIAIVFNKYLYSLMTFRQKCIYYIGFIFPVPEDSEVLPLPKNLHFLYFPLRPLLWAWRKTKRQTISNG